MMFLEFFSQLDEIIMKIEDGWSCLKCNKFAQTKQHIRSHAETHINVKYTCPQCDKIFNSSNSMLSHVSRYHK